MMVADIANPYYHVMVRKVQDVARKQGYDVLIANSDHDPELERHFIQGIMRRPVDGVVLTPYHLSSAEIGALIERTGARAVLVGQHLSPPGVDRVFADDENAAYDAVRWLIKKRGHRRIAYIAVPGTHPSACRVAGLMRAIVEAGLPMPVEYLETGDFNVESGARATERRLALAQTPTVLLACNDLMALGCITKAQQLGRSVPGNLAVVGFDNIPEAARVSPKLTTIAKLRWARRCPTPPAQRSDGWRQQRHSVDSRLRLIPVSGMRARTHERPHAHMRSQTVSCTILQRQIVQGMTTAGLAGR